MTDTGTAANAPGVLSGGPALFAGNPVAGQVDFTPGPADTTPGLLSQVVALLTRHAMGYVAGILGAVGYLSTSEKSEIVNLAGSLVGILAPIAWSLYQKLTTKAAIQAVTK